MKKLLLFFIFCASCKANYRINEVEHLIAGEASKIWDWDTDDMCGNIYPCVGIVFYSNHILSKFRYFAQERDTTILLRQTKPNWACLTEERTWRVLNDTALMYQGDTCRLVYISSDTLIISLKVNNYSADNIIRYIKPHKSSIITAK